MAQDPGAGQKVGAKVDDAVQDIKGGLRKAGDAAKEQFSRAKTAVHDMGVESRVYGRIHWDKALNGRHDRSLGDRRRRAITLNGTVADAKAKAQGRRAGQGDGGRDQGRRPCWPSGPATTTTAP